MYNAVVALDPENKAYYAKNLHKLMTSLDSLDNAVTAKLQGKQGEAFVVWHPSLSYFARDYGLEQIALSPEGKEVSIASLQATIDSARADNARVFFIQKDIDSRQADVANQQIGAKPIAINPLSYNWDKEILTIANALAE
jgi:zinc transport system substrate-binding protein